ncbi:hypothetical protein ACFWCR_41355 [Streptomyces goshikiensis]|uniref:hypothetical protein n=1 Tax=Streptomyces goshikiensis TaxID=1942 RepID=UPI0036C89E3F
MGSELDLPDEFRSEVEAAFSFLLEEAGFAGPERTEHGLLFRGPGLGSDPAVDHQAGSSARHCIAPPHDGPVGSRTQSIDHPLHWVVTRS